MWLGTHRVSRQQGFPHPGSWLPATIALVVSEHTHFGEQTKAIMAMKLAIAFFAKVMERLIVDHNSSDKPDLHLSFMSAFLGQMGNAYSCSKSPGHTF